jgi:hypothetical protein
MCKKSLIVLILIFSVLLASCQMKAVIQPAQFQIIGDAGIEIAIDARDSSPKNFKWVTTLTPSTLNDYLQKTYGLFNFNHVTSQNGVDFFSLGLTELHPTQQGYIELPIHIRSNSYQSISLNNMTITSNHKQWVADVSFTDSFGNAISSGQTMIVQLASAIRVSFQGNDYISAFELPESTFNTVLGAGYLPNINQLKGMMSYYHAKSGDIPGGGNEISVVPTQTTFTDHQLFVLEANQNDHSGAQYYGKLIIRVWVEGFDLEAYNAILDQVVTIGITFTGV